MDVPRTRSLCENGAWRWSSGAAFRICGSPPLRPSSRDPCRGLPRLGRREAGDERGLDLDVQLRRPFTDGQGWLVSPSGTDSTGQRVWELAHLRGFWGGKGLCTGGRAQAPCADLAQSSPWKNEVWICRLERAVQLLRQLFLCHDSRQMKILALGQGARLGRQAGCWYTSTQQTKDVQQTVLDHFGPTFAFGDTLSLSLSSCLGTHWSPLASTVASVHWSTGLAGRSIPVPYSPPLATAMSRTPPRAKYTQWPGEAPATFCTHTPCPESSAKNVSPPTPS